MSFSFRLNPGNHCLQLYLLLGFFVIIVTSNQNAITQSFIHIPDFSNHLVNLNPAPFLQSTSIQSDNPFCSNVCHNVEEKMYCYLHYNATFLSQPDRKKVPLMPLKPTDESGRLEDLQTSLVSGRQTDRSRYGT